MSRQILASCRCKPQRDGEGHEPIVVRKTPEPAPGGAETPDVEAHLSLISVFVATPVTGHFCERVLRDHVQRITWLAASRVRVLDGGTTCGDTLAVRAYN